jgi:cytoskeletal protein CcmA (bactofilin family)
MFRKKDTDAEIPASGEGAFRRSSGEASKPTLQPDFARRKVELPHGSPGSTTAAPSGSAAEARGSQPTGQIDPDRYGKCLIVGDGIRLSGEISSCDRLVVQGEVEVTLNDTRALEIARSGRFTGGCEVEEADISGVYEGDLTVRKHLVVRATGKLTGTVRYAQLELERGGQIAGNISVVNAETGASSASGARGVDRRARSLAETGMAEDASKAS